MKSLDVWATVLLAGAVMASGCANSAEAAPKKPKKQGAHVRVVNATDGPLSFILYPQQLNDQNQPGESNPFQKVVPGDKKLQVLTPDKKLLHEFDVTLHSGTPTTFVVRGTPKALKVDRIDDEPRFGDETQATVLLSSGYDGSPVAVTLRGASSEVALGEASKIGAGSPKNVTPGLYEVVVDGKAVAKRELESGVVYSIMIRSFKGRPAASILRNSPPEMRVVGVEAGSGPG